MRSAGDIGVVVRISNRELKVTETVRGELVDVTSISNRELKARSGIEAMCSSSGWQHLK